ncbi:MAG: GIY-YIG nuclease family protein [Candidatus Zambryskibacteria bacterium]|nr:GIY-YIG nuclease family protein [Candidatus Zambryskibacteria bacterium]
MDHFLYILNNALGKYYIGITKLLPNDRLVRHNRGEVTSTKSGRPWKIIYTEVHKIIKTQE